MPGLRTGLRILAFWTACLGASCPAKAESLFDAFEAAYASNPVLGAQRAAVRVGVKDKDLAETGYYPSVISSGDIAYQNVRSHSPQPTGTVDRTTHPRGFGSSISQNLFNGFQTTNSVAREDASLAAARETLRETEQQVLLDVATAYADVLRDRAIADLRRADCDLQARRAKEIVLRFQIGNVTRTDIDQSNASQANAQADLVVAKTNIEASVAAFRAVVGHDPGKLKPAGVPSRLIPRSLPSALAIADAEHPSITSAADILRAAELNIDVQKGGYAPSLDVTMSAERRWDPDYYVKGTTYNGVAMEAKLSVPIFDRGVTLASVGRATELAGQQAQQLDHERAAARAAVVKAWGAFSASAALIASANAAIRSSDRAFSGIEIEAATGQRTTFDVLTAQRTLLDARVNRVIADHDRVISGYRLLAGIGRLSLDRITARDTVGGSEPPAPENLRRAGRGLVGASILPAGLMAAGAPPRVDARALAGAKALAGDTTVSGRETGSEASVAPEPVTLTAARFEASMLSDRPRVAPVQRDDPQTRSDPWITTFTMRGGLDQASPNREAAASR